MYGVKKIKEIIENCEVNLMGPVWLKASLRPSWMVKPKTKFCQAQPQPQPSGADIALISSKTPTRPPPEK